MNLPFSEKRCPNRLFSAPITDQASPNYMMQNATVVADHLEKTFVQDIEALYEAAPRLFTYWD